MDRSKTTFYADGKREKLTDNENAGLINEIDRPDKSGHNDNF